MHRLARTLAITTLMAAFVTSAQADDTQLCVSGKPAEIVAACSRLIVGRFKKSPLLPTVFYNRGIGHDGLGNYDAAIRDYTETIRLKPSAQAYTRRGGSHWSKQQFDHAIEDYNKALQLDPKSYYILSNRGNAYLGKGEFQHAITDYDKALQLAPRRIDKAQCLALRGEAKRLLGDLDGAIADLDESIRLGPQGALFYVYRGNALRYKGDFASAHKDFDKAIQIHPDFTPAFTGRGLTYERQGNQTKAIEAFEKAVAFGFVKWDSRSDYDTSLARLAAVKAGAVTPEISPVPGKAVSTTSLPTTTVAIPIKAAPQKLATDIARQSSRRVALAIGNATYQKVPELFNPKSDADTVAASLKNIGFDSVEIVLNATREALIQSLRAFAEQAENADWAMVYYAGHGIEVNGQNYLIPVDAALRVDRDVQFEAVPMDQVMTALEGAKKLKLVVLDACRDNPFTTQIRRTTIPETQSSVSTAGATIASRSIGRGLAEVRVQGASLVAFAAKHGQTALDGDGRNSPFAIALVRRITSPGLELNKMFRLVRDDVMEATAGRQEPYTYGSLPGREDFYFVAPR